MAAIHPIVVGPVVHVDEAVAPPRVDLAGVVRTARDDVVALPAGERADPAPASIDGALAGGGPCLRVDSVGVHVDYQAGRQALAGRRFVGGVPLVFVAAYGVFSPSRGVEVVVVGTGTTLEPVLTGAAGDGVYAGAVAPQAEGRSLRSRTGNPRRRGPPRCRSRRGRRLTHGPIDRPIWSVLVRWTAPRVYPSARRSSAFRDGAEARRPEATRPVART